MSFNLGEELNKVTKPYVTQAQQGEAIKQLLRAYTKEITPTIVQSLEFNLNEPHNSVAGYNKAITTIETNAAKILGDEK